MAIDPLGISQPTEQPRECLAYQSMCLFTICPSEAADTSAANKTPENIDLTASYT